jgi:hypothetical protein
MASPEPTPPDPVEIIMAELPASASRNLRRAWATEILADLRDEGWHVVRFNPDAPEETWHLLIDDEWTP